MRLVRRGLQRRRNDGTTSRREGDLNPRGAMHHWMFAQNSGFERLAIQRHTGLGYLVITIPVGDIDINLF